VAHIFAGFVGNLRLFWANLNEDRMLDDLVGTCAVRAYGRNIAVFEIQSKGSS
jgi:hypothetical protein